MIQKSKKINKKSDLTLVIPCFKESDRLPIFLSSLIKNMPQDIRYVIVDDGSPIADYNLLLERVKPFLSQKVSLLRYEKNRGKGGAIEFGLEHANTEYVGFLDADGSIPDYEVINLWQYTKMHPDLDLILSSRIKLLGKQIDRTLKRHLSGRIFVTYLNFLFNVPVYDSQCGYKIFKKSLFNSIQVNIINKRWLWDTELVILSYLNGYKCIEIAIDWKDVQGSKVSLFSDAIKMALGLWNFKKLIVNPRGNKI
jgi:glycosyltransferase involved in cell wall biosynthesis